MSCLFAITQCCFALLQFLSEGFDFLDTLSSASQNNVFSLLPHECTVQPYFSRHRHAVRLIPRVR